MRFALVAALLVATGACGDDAQTRRDGGGGDDGGGSDDSMIDADPNVRGTVTVHIVDKNGAALAGMYVVFIDTDATVTELMTDAGGMAQADVYPNASVTALRTRGMSYSLATVQALNPGDVITLISAASTVSTSEDPFSQRLVPMPGADIAASPNGASKSGSIATYTTVAPHGLVVGDSVVVTKVAVAGYNGTWTVASTPSATTFTANIGAGNLASSGTNAVGATAMKAVPFTVNYGANTGTDHYEVHTRCATVNVGLATSAQIALPIGCTTTPMNIEVIARSSAGAVLAWTQQANVAITAGGSTTISDTWHAPAQLAATYTNPTAQVSDITVARFSPYVRGLPVAEAMSPTSVTTNVNLNASFPPSASLSTSLLCPLSTTPGCLTTTSGAASQRITQAVDGTATAYALDIGANLLPWVKALYVPTTTSIDITVTGSGAFDIFEANLQYTRGQSIYVWRVFGPVAQSVTFPTLPATAPGDPTVRPTDVQSTYQAFVGESDAINGYRDAIKNPFEALGTCDANSNPVAKPYPGTKNRISQWN